MNIAAIKAYLSATSLSDPSNIPIDLYTQIDSTNDYLKRLLPSAPVLPRVCLADAQTVGRGQMGKQWYSPPGQNIYLSIAFTCTQPLRKLMGLSVLAADAVIKALACCGFSQDIQIKWPNDILYQDQKLAGILVETITRTAHETYIVVGVGLNVNMMDTPENAVTQSWTSLALISNTTQDRNKLVAMILEQFFAHFVLFVQAG